MKKSEIVRSIIGALFVIGGFSGILSGDVLAGLLMGVFGISLFPIVYDKLKISTEKKIHIIAPIVLFLITSVFMPSSETEINNNISSNTSVIQNGISNENIITDESSKKEIIDIKEENATISDSSSISSSSNSNSPSNSDISVYTRAINDNSSDLKNDSSSSESTNNNLSSTSSSTISSSSTDIKNNSEDLKLIDESKDSTSSSTSVATNTKSTTLKEDTISQTYILNNNTKRFHEPSCGSAAKIKEKNKGTYTGSRDELISKGYQSCGNCHP